MTEKKIYQTQPDIAKKVEAMYPIAKRKNMCNLDKQRYDGKRWAMAVRLFNEIGKPEMQFK